MELNSCRIPFSVWIARSQIKNILKTYFKNILADVSVPTDFCEKDGSRKLTCRTEQSELLLLKRMMAF